MKRIAETLLKGRYIVSAWRFEREKRKERMRVSAVTRSEKENREE